MVNVLSTFFLFMFFGMVSYAQVSIKAYTDTTDYFIGDRIRLTIQVSYPENYHIVYPNYTDSLGGVDVWDIKSPVLTSSDGRIKSVTEIIMSRFDSAEVIIPAFQIFYKKMDSPDQKIAPLFGTADSSYESVNSEPVVFTVHTMKINRAEEIKDIKAPVTIPLDWRLVLFYILLAAGVIILAAQIYIYFMYRKKLEPEAKAAYTPKMPPHVIALNALNELEKKKLWQRGDVKLYHSEITGIIRQYFEDRYRMPALELSTTEVLGNLQERSNTGTVIKITSMFLNNADLVKFARFNPVPSINEEMMNQAREIVKLTEFVPAAHDVEEVSRDV